eukprot:gnl/MRDRNA2_/MRDRNA2_95052_c0_seq1.p1 gnl/MRDRNA2_/MRDRNA2_95052_c0~~gnl/MRDRNA2_/MRDRNA2_95052_c0_seq1.p1  ORF type:complete len:512 (-),score=43.08 gnl/MRDRNA2_/MRDRNA2_95052_c0_seq1:446-1981(-)
MARVFQTSQPYGGEVQMGLSPSRIQQYQQSENPAIRAGGAILAEAPEVFPATRKCRDVLWSLVFVALLGVLGYLAYTESKSWSFDGHAFMPDAKKAGLKAVLVSMMSSVIAACLLSVFFLVLIRCCTKLIVWATLLFAPTVSLLFAMSFVAFPKFWNFEDKDTVLPWIFCASLAVPALLMFMCYCVCWRKLIEFTANILYAVAGVLEQHLGLCLVAMVSLLCSVAWTILCATAVVAVSDRWFKNQHDCDKNPASDACMGEGSFYGLYALTFMIFCWGVTVFQNVAHTTNCGVFGRWYFNKPASVVSSLWVSLTTSFGSICLGSLIVAFISALEASLRAFRRNDRNTVTQIVLCLLDCLISCIRDMMEAFSYFAYVQVAMRGLSFWSSARVTFTLCKWDNLFALVATTLVGNVCALGSLMCGLLSGLVGYLVGAKFVPQDLSKDEISNIHMVNIVSAVVLGMVTSRTILNVLRSGFATIVVCWAENKETLRTLHSRLYEDFSQRSLQGVALL